jgi:predicted dehydrogenase
MHEVTAIIPGPRTPPQAPSLRWGVIGAGGIAGTFVSAAHTYSNQRFFAVAARSPQRAAEFGREYSIERVHPTYESLVADPEVDVVYIATTHNAHAELALLAIEAGKHVLVEKPFATERAEAASVAHAAREAQVFAMEAMWTRYIPQADVIRQMLDEGVIGAVETVVADFGFHCPFDPHHRLYDPEQAGGALLDAGVYPISFTSWVLGPPQSVSATGHVASTGVDSDATVLIDHGGRQSVALTSLITTLPVRAMIAGSLGWIDVHSPFLGPSGLTLHLGSPVDPESRSVSWEDRALPKLHDGLSYEADAVARFVADGLLESPVHSLDETVAIVAALESARAQVLSAGQATFAH